MIESQVAPGLLIAMPALLDPNFARAVILMVETAAIVPTGDGAPN